MAGIQGGFECEFVEKPPKIVQSECPVCLLILREPYQATCCGYSFCRVCIEPIKVRNLPCPCCKADKFDHYPNKGLQRSLYEFKVKCTNKDKGCQWVGELGQLDNHLNLKSIEDKQLQGCPLAQIQCLYCSKLFHRSNIPVHQVKQCCKRPFSCEYCGELQSTYEDVTTNHWPMCAQYPVPCPNNCGETLQRQNVDSHVTDECLLTVIDCDFRHVGCEVTLARKDLSKHLTENIVGHVSMLTISHKNLEEENKQLKNQVVRLEHNLKDLTTNSAPVCVDFTMTDFNQHKQVEDKWVSPPFYSHPHGYKMCLTVHANGIGPGEGTHVSIFIYIMPGEHDNILQWPFQGTVTITLFGKVSSLERTIFCIDDNVLDRVTEGEFSTSGCGKPCFIPHSSLGTHLYNDSLHFRISQVSVTVTKK